MKKNLRLVYCINSLENFGGMERVLLDRVDYLIKNYGYDITIITTEIEKGERFFYLNPKIKTINLNIDYYNILNGIKNEGKLLNIVAFLKKMLLKEKKRREHLKKLQFEIEKINPDIIISMGDLSRDIVGKIKSKAKKILENHFNKEFLLGEDIENKILRYFKVNIKTRLKKINLKNYDKFIVLTEEDKVKWIKMYKKYEKKIKVVNNPLTFYPKKVSTLENKKVISLGRLTNQKGYDLLVKIWSIVNKEYPDWVLEIYGEGIERKKLESQIEKLNLKEKIKLKGVTKHPDEKLYEASIYVMSSRFEGLPLTLIEAMSCGLPLVSFDCPCGPKDVITDGKNGFLCKFGDIEMMAEKIKYLIKNNDERKRMGNISKKISLNFKKEKIMENWKEIYEK